MLNAYGYVVVGCVCVCVPVHMAFVVVFKGFPFYIDRAHNAPNISTTAKMFTFELHIRLNRSLSYLKCVRCMYFSSIDTVLITLQCYMRCIVENSLEPVKKRKLIKISKP